VKIFNRPPSYANLILIVALAATPLSLPATGSESPNSVWARPGPNGKLAYKATPNGDTIMDFSHAGYMGGGVALPTVPVRRTVQPSGGADDSAAIQNAINEVAALDLENGFRGAVLLAPGIFTCSNVISISASGVVLRGSGSGGVTGKKTTIKLTGRPHLAIAIRAPGSSRRRGGADDEPMMNSAPLAAAEFKAAETEFTDSYVPSGARAFTVADTTGFAVGDIIAIRRPVTEAWVKFMEMHDLVRDDRAQTWIRAGASITTERKIAAISGKTITVDVPFSDSFDARYMNPPGTAVVKMRPSVRISQSGVEHLHIESPPQPFNHTQSHFTALRINGEDCWVRDVIADETMNSVAVNGRRITLERVAVNRKAIHQGSSKPAEFAPNGGQVLLDRCSGIGDNVWYSATGAGQAGPIVLLNCTFTGNGRIESHQRWTTGVLYDNCRVPGGGIDFRNRGSMGSGHGWSMGWGVMWNCVADNFVVQDPPGAVNWMIGCVGESRPMPRPFDREPNLKGGTMDSHGTPVTPQSLYLTQLAERLGAQAVKNIGY
jgi:hypothetical protein